MLAQREWMNKYREQIISQGMLRRGEIVKDLTARPSCRAICALVAEDHGFTLASLRGKGRYRGLVIARRVAAILCRQRLGASTPQIGRALNRDPSTIFHHLALSNQPDFDWAPIRSSAKVLESILPVDSAQKSMGLANSSLAVVKGDSCVCG